VHSECEPLDKIVHVNWFVLPPLLEYYFKDKNLSYKSLPPYRPDCATASSIMSMDLIYPKFNSKIFIPVELDGKPGSAIFELAHRSATATVYWHLDGEFIGSTKKIHHMPLNPTQGKHMLTLVDETGETLERQFEIISKR
jgi:penicillin-binding protein 1C